MTRPAIRVIYYKLERTAHGHLSPVENFDLPVQPSNTNLFLLCPLVIEHKIDQSSPLHPISPSKLYSLQDNSSNTFEIVVIIEGTMETTGDACQYRTSYRPREILWGFRFKQTNFEFEDGKINFDMSTFEEFEPVNMNAFVKQTKIFKVASTGSQTKNNREQRRRRRTNDDIVSQTRINA